MPVNCPYSDTDECPLIAEVARLKTRVLELEATNHKLTGGDSTLPEKTKPKFKPSRRTRKRMKKLCKKKGQPGGGRKKPDHIDETIDHKLDRCPDCGHPLGDENAFEICPYYQEDIIPAQVKATCYRHLRYRCPNCKKVHGAPAKGYEIPHARLGPRSLLAAALYKHAFAMPYNKIAEMLNQTCGLKTTASGLAQGVIRQGKRFQGEIEALEAAIRASPAVNIDETGWRVNGINHWLWTFTNEFHTLYKIDRSRGSKVPLAALGENYGGVVGFDFTAPTVHYFSPSRSVIFICLENCMKLVK